jgi:hypothetical protein
MHKPELQFFVLVLAAKTEEQGRNTKVTDIL